jgi:hypothetical protein
MDWRSYLFLPVLLITGCSPSINATMPAQDWRSRVSPGPHQPVSKPVAFVPGVPGRSADEFCNSTSPECERWTALAIKCEDALRQRDAGYMGRQEPYCDQAEQYREQVTGIALSSDPGAYNF